MAQRKAKPDTNPKDDPIVFEDLQGNPEDGPEDLESIYADTGDDDDAGWQPPEEIEPRHPRMTEEADLPSEDDEPEEEDDDGGELETADEAEAADTDEEVDEDLKNLPPEAQRAIQAARREAEQNKAEVERYRRLEYDYNLGRAKEQEQTLNSTLERQRADLRQAIEDGDTDKQVKLQEEIADTKIGLRDWSHYRTQLERQGGPPQPQGQPKQDGPTPEAQKWLKVNEWFEKPGYEQVSEHVRKVDVNLSEEGFDPNSPEYFAELNRRVKGRFPDAPIKGLGKQAARSRTQGKRSPVGAPDKGAAPQRTQGRRGKVTLNAEDRENMRRFGLDPRDPEHAKIYAQEKRKSDANDRRNRGAR